MDAQTLGVLTQVGIGAVLLYLYLRQSEDVAALRAELRTVREQQWNLIVKLIGEDVAAQIAEKPPTLD